ncbi:MAG: non-canonical purine NTP pyrophosphatase, RdgB/HAM1 family [Gammaproteobacteria bacterium HGW-Gammaproteobacteria-8]|nr:MAG: non-canonical purine NTP pyrophosphatase, RdgB/HAM1 family [Gammaproteobacteria bacterium HGW-Gammaproteobacteria-8]
MARPRLVIATENAGKLAEFRQMLEPRGFEVLPQADFSVAEVEETGASFVENALLKARAAAAASGVPALADDSGLVVDVLEGRPGIRSARYAGEPANPKANIERLLEELQGLPRERRGASFYCCLVLLRYPEDPAPLIATGRWQGYILEAPRGEGGFGYDPVFLEPRLDVTAAELPAVEKNRISHRGKALEQLLAQLDAEGL